MGGNIYILNFALSPIPHEIHMEWVWNRCGMHSAWEFSCKTTKRSRLHQTWTSQDQKFPEVTKTVTVVWSSVLYDFWDLKTSLTSLNWSLQPWGQVMLRSVFYLLFAYSWLIIIALRQYIHVRLLAEVEMLTNNVINNKQRWLLSPTTTSFTSPPQFLAIEVLKRCW